MTDKLTLSDCFKYPNARINYHSSRTGNIVAQFRDVFDFILFRRFDAGDDIANCKLILRDISELTDEEKQHIDKLACFSPIRYIIYESNEYDYSLMEDDLQIFDYLRSINIDIDGFLQSGKAVKG